MSSTPSGSAYRASARSLALQQMPGGWGVGHRARSIADGYPRRPRGPLKIHEREEQAMKLIYTYTDEAPALATHSLLPIVEAFAAPGGRRHRAARHLAGGPHPRPVPGPADGRAAGAGRAGRARRAGQDARGEHHQAAEHQRLDPAAQGGDQGAAGRGLRRPGLPGRPARRRREGRARGLRPRQGLGGQPGAARGQLRPARARVGEVLRAGAPALDGRVVEGQPLARGDDVATATSARPSCR